jgi:hypothetical protein
MGTRRDFVAWHSALSLAGLARPLPADERPEEEAADAARDWLALVDAGGSSASWREAAPAFRLAVTPEQWDEGASYFIDEQGVERRRAPRAPERRAVTVLAA